MQLHGALVQTQRCWFMHPILHQHILLASLESLNEILRPSLTLFELVPCGFVKALVALFKSLLPFWDYLTGKVIWVADTHSDTWAASSDEARFALE